MKKNTTIQHLKFFLIIVFLNFCVILQLKAQDPVHVVDSELRALFTPLSKPAGHPLFLYDMAAHVIDSHFYHYNIPDTINYDTWNMMYEELRYCAYDTSGFITADSVYNYTNFVGKDTVTMNILAYNYYRFIDSALTTNTYFTWDTVAETLSDKSPRPGYPYILDTVFAACPAVKDLPYKTVVYRIDPNEIFKDSWNLITTGDNRDTLKIDFGDGTGWHAFDITVLSYYTATYAAAGQAIIKTAVFHSGLKKISQAIVGILDAVLPTPPDLFVSSPGLTGMNVGEYTPCSAGASTPTKKYLIYVEGFDFGDFIPKGNRTAADIYSQQIESTGLANLRNFGYQIYVVDWQNSRISIEDNAMNLVSLIREIKCEIAGTEGDEQIVIIGESMGGLVARFALAWMENNPPAPGECLPEKMHDVRELITFDSPNGGANIPLAYQHFYRDPTLSGEPIIGIMERSVGIFNKVLLDATSAQEMLLYDVDTRIPPVGGPGYYYEHPNRTKFKSDLAALGNYPKYCKLFATCNGNFNGLNQTRVWDGALRNPNDTLAKFLQTFYVRLFKHDYNILSFDAGLFTSPNGSGPLTQMSLSIWIPKIHLSWFGIKIRLEAQPIVGNEFDAINLTPYDVAPGSTVEAVHESAFEDLKNVVFGWDPPATSGFGNYFQDRYSGGKVFGGGFSLSLHTDGMHYCFVPTVSAIDFNYSSLNDDIRSMSAATITSKTPFDIVMGWTDQIPNPYSVILDPSRRNIHKFNMDHLDVRNDFLTNWQTTGTDTSERGVEEDYVTCVKSGSSIPIQMLNREIGDDSLLIENRVQPWKALYEAEKYIGVNENSPYYEYPSSYTALTIPGVYSKDSILKNTLLAEFGALGGNVNYYGIPYGPYSIISMGWQSCCDAYKYSPQAPPILSTSIFIIYPNPIISNDINIKFSAQKDAFSKLEIYNILGQKITSIPFTVDQINPAFTQSFNVNATNMASGIYMVVVYNGNRVFRQKIIITR